MITEQQKVKFWHWLKNKLGKVKGIDMQRIENTTGSGVPDVSMCYKGTEAWVELKVYVQGNVVLRKEQYAWLIRRARANGNVMVMVCNPDAGAVEIFTPPFNGRPWGNKSQYVALTNEPEFSFSKTININLLLKYLFEHC